MPRTTLIVIIVVASCVAGIAAIWTIIRKTKFSPSKRFESKLEPIDFVPSGRIGQNHQRNNESQSSFPATGHSEEKFTSGGMAGYGAGNGYAGSLERSGSEKSSAPDPSYGGYGNQYPNHNYQQQHPAGYPSQPAQYGYSDLQRGPPPNANHRAYLNGNGQPDYYQQQQGRY